ncbi:MAG TPA: hypothetical protein VM915_09495 [Verrucomicrobiae bacterium]|nr:hypothetical protein [Verrucomicrobiae bacterium]
MKMMRVGASVGALVVVLLAGCTTLDVRRMNLNAPDPERIFYVLPFTQYDVAITRQVTKCGASMDIEVSVEATPAIADDWREAYEIDQRSLSQLFNTAKLSIEFHEDENKQRTNRIRSINASIEDQTLPAIGHLIPSIGRLAALPGPTGGPLNPGQPPPEACSPAVAAALAEVTRLTDEVKSLTRQLEADNTAIAQMRRQRLALGLTDTDQPDPAFTNRLAQRAQRIASIIDAQNEMQPHMRAISNVQNVRWPESSGIFETDNTGFTIASDVVRQWRYANAPPPATTVMNELVVHMRLQRTTPAGRNIFGDGLATSYGALRPAAAAQPAPEARRESARAHRTGYPPRREAAGPTVYVQPDGGLRYRVPAPGQLVVCQEVRCAADTPADSILKRVNGPVAQLGYIQTIPIRARFLENVSFQATFSTSGAPTSVGYQSTGAGAAASQQLGAILGQVATVREADRTWDAAAPQRELQRQQTILQTLQAEAAIAAARNPTGAETGALATETALVRARIAMLEAERQWTALNTAAP